MFYGAVVWDPYLIVAQIVCLQCLYYLTLGVFMGILVGTRVSRMSLVYFFDYATVTASTITGWCVIAAFVLSSFSGAVYMLYFIERAKWCLDFSATLYIIHLFVCIIYGGWPSSITWWVVNGSGVAVMVLLGEHLCRKRELREIPTARYRSRKIKLNTDGSTRRNGGGGGFGGLFRDETGSWISGYYGKLEICTSLEAELWAVYKGLIIILQRGLNQVVIETDAEQVVQLLSEELREKCPFRGIVEDARIIMRGCDCSIQHIKREANICADALAKLGENQPAELLIVNDPPAEIRHLLIADIVHISQEGART